MPRSPTGTISPPQSHLNRHLPHVLKYIHHKPIGDIIHQHILTTTVPMQQYPQSPDVTGATQPPVYHQDPNAQYAQQQQYPQQYPQQPQSPPPMHAQPQQYPQQPQSPPPQQAHPQSYEQQQKAYGSAPAAQPGMPPQQQSGPVYQNATPIASLGRGPAPADCPACGQRSMTNCAFETGNTTQ